MVQFPCARGRAFVCKNIGDYVQAVATRQFVNPIDQYVEQEEANLYQPEDGIPIRLIMNGWFQWRAENWPPSPWVKPLLVSMHISPIKAEQLLTAKGVAFLRKNAPVGCRDYYTQQLLEQHGVPAYFSACMTLTLGRKYHVASEQRKGIYFVDPYFEVPPLRNEYGKFNWNILGKVLKTVMAHPSVVWKLSQRDFFKKYSPTGFLDRNTHKYRPIYKAALFYRVYSRKFTRRMLLDAEYITHWMDVDMKTSTNDQLLGIAEDLVRKYAAARMIVTSRIHAGLPCLGTETPVVFVANEQVTSENGSFNTPGRLGGLLEFFRVMSLEGNVFSTADSVLAGFSFFDTTSTFSNKEDWKPYALRLAKQAEDFMK